MNQLKRRNSQLTIATFYEYFQFNKYNFDPDYQRPADVWVPADKSFLIDTILKNFPIPPIFLHERIEKSSGKTSYDIIDGKQRLGAIVAFIENKIKIPIDFGNDAFGDAQLNGKTFQELDSIENGEWKAAWWRYQLTIEYVDSDQIEVIANIFDRLNRNGEPLTSQELRNAKYNSTDFYKVILELAEMPEFQFIFQNSRKNRLEHLEYTADLFIVVMEGKAFAGDGPKNLDQKFEQYSSKQRAEFDPAIQMFKDVAKIFAELNIDFNRHNNFGFSHVYGLWLFSYAIHKLGLSMDGIPEKLDDFYTRYGAHKDDKDIASYRATMSAGTKGLGRRKTRAEALLRFCGFNDKFPDN